MISRYKQPKPKRCAKCKDEFPNRGMKKYCMSCERKIHSGNIEEMSREELIELPLPTLLDAAEGMFNLFIRERDKDGRCISCGKNYTHENPIQAGHFYAAGMHPGLRFNENNAHGQCFTCNIVHHGNTVQYATRLEKKIGLSKLAELIVIADGTKNYKWSRIELAEVIIEYREKLKTTKNR